jgi:AcrR family transcriptional regulator
MPKTVDHEARRKELLVSVWRVVVRDGLDKTTMRAIAKETGWSSGVLAHYFADKDDIIESARRYSQERIEDRWDEKLAELHGLAALRELVLDNLPLDEERVEETRFLMNYWARAIRTDDGAPAELGRRGPTLIERLTQLIAEAQTAGEMVDGSAADMAERLLALIDGLSLHALLYPGRVTRERQVALAEQELDRLTVAQSQEETH